MQTYHKRNGQKPSDIFVCSLVNKDLFFTDYWKIPVNLGGTIPRWYTGNNHGTLVILQGVWWHSVFRVWDVSCPFSSSKMCESESVPWLESCWCRERVRKYPHHKFRNLSSQPPWVLFLMMEYPSVLPHWKRRQRKDSQTFRKFVT